MAETLEETCFLLGFESQSLSLEPEPLSRIDYNFGLKLYHMIHKANRALTIAEYERSENRDATSLFSSAKEFYKEFIRVYTQFKEIVNRYPGLDKKSFRDAMVKIEQQNSDLKSRFEKH